MSTTYWTTDRDRTTIWTTGNMGPSWSGRCSCSSSSGHLCNTQKKSQWIVHNCLCLPLSSSTTLCVISIRFSSEDWKKIKINKGGQKKIMRRWSRTKTASGKSKETDTQARAKQRRKLKGRMIETNFGKSVRMTLLCNFMQRPFKGGRSRHKKKKKGGKKPRERGRMKYTWGRMNHYHLARRNKGSGREKIVQQQNWGLG